MPVWVPGQGETFGFHRRDISRAIAAGLTYRPLPLTAADTLAWFSTLPPSVRPSCAPASRRSARPWASAVGCGVGRMDRSRRSQQICDRVSDWRSLVRPRVMDWQLMGARAMSQRDKTADAEIKALIETWADAVRRHDLPAILATSR